MYKNVGTAERYGRLSLGVAAGIAAMNAHGWQRAMLGVVAASGIGTALAQYCPLNEALGVDTLHTVDERMSRDTHELRRHAQMAGALGTPPSVGTDMPPVTREGDMFGSGRE